MSLSPLAKQPGIPRNTLRPILHRIESKRSFCLHLSVTPKMLESERSS